MTTRQHVKRVRPNRIFEAKTIRRGMSRVSMPRTISPDHATNPAEPMGEPTRVRAALSPERMRQERDAALLAADSVSMLHAEAATVALLSASEERDLLARAQAGDATARERMVKANLGLVAQVAHYYRNAPHDAAINLDDLIAEGLIGLLRAIELFDLTTSYRFSTYATWWIRQAITRALINTGHAVRVPVRMYERQHVMLCGVIAARDAVMNGELPAGAFLSDGQPGPLLLARLAVERGMTPQEGAEALRLAEHARDPRSLDAAHLLDARNGGSGDTYTLAETLEAEDTEALLAAAEERADLAALLAPGGVDAPESALAAVKRLLARQDAYRRHGRDIARELTIVLRRILADDDERPSLETLAREFGCSRERIRQLEAAGLDLLRREYLRANPGKRPSSRPQKTAARESGQEGGAV